MSEGRADPPPPEPGGRRTLSYGEAPPVPGHVDDLLKLNTGCLVVAILWFGLPLGILMGLAIREGAPPWRAVPVGYLPFLSIPLVLGLIWWFSPRIRAAAARRMPVARGQRLRRGEIVLEAEVVEKRQAMGRPIYPLSRTILSLVRSAPTPVPVYLLTVKFRVNGLVVTSRRDVGSEAWHRLEAGDRIRIAVHPRRRSRWRVLDRL